MKELIKHIYVNIIIFTSIFIVGEFSVRIISKSKKNLDVEIMRYYKSLREGPNTTNQYPLHYKNKVGVGKAKPFEIRVKCFAAINQVNF